MQRVIMRAVFGMVLLTCLPIALVRGADLKVIQTHQAKDMTITLLSESGQWTQGKNSFVLELTSADTNQPVIDERRRAQHIGHIICHTVEMRRGEDQRWGHRDRTIQC